MKKTTGPFKLVNKLVLASGSPRRQQMLADLGLEFEVCPSPLDEPAPNAGETPSNYAQRMAEMKTRDISRNNSGKTVLGADTIVVLNDRIMGKPKDEGHALEMLTALAGQTHQVISAYCIVTPSGEVISQTVSTDVDMRVSGKAELKGYIATGEPSDKAGAYAIQGIGTFLVTAIRGSYTNVVGLPLARVIEELLKRELIEPNE